MLFRSFRASMMRSSGASSSWVLNTSRTASRTAIMPLMRAAADAERLVGSKLLPLRMTMRAVALGISAVLDAGEGIGVEQRQGAGRALRPSGCRRPPAGHSTARLEQLRRELAFERRLGAAVHGAFEFHRARASSRDGGRSIR